MMRAEAIQILVFLGDVELGDRHFLDVWGGIQCFFRLGEFCRKPARGSGFESAEVKHLILTLIIGKQELLQP